ncbi:MAG: Stp1/IreP family PP2C-type Ser/Thr phosphatase [Anaerolineae bacterium]|nr:Stp1/IreP family PP2C-type Ser/Thr phosphatase [Anaerolineae bacterium]
MMDKRTCPQCGYENVRRAVFCFQCGASLDSSPAQHGIHRRHRPVEEAVQSLNHPEDAPDSALSQRLRAARSDSPPALEGIPIICLRCGTRNAPPADSCAGCGAALTLPRDAAPADLVPRAAARSSVGRVRGNNEDRIGLWARQGVVLALVADGMGGALAGEEASRLTLETIHADFVGEAHGSEGLHTLSDNEVAGKLRRSIRRANRVVMRRAAGNREFQGMGTTVTLAFVRGAQVLVAHIGDSRAYMISGSGGWISQITDDHSFVEALMAAGHITPEQAAVHPMRNVLYRALGQVDDTEADLYVRPLSAGDWLMLCSDGLTRHVTGAEMVGAVQTGATPDEVARRLVALANERGGEDNISVVAIAMQRADEIVPGA